MQTSQRCRDSIKTMEGFVDHIYADAAGYPTVGYGHLLTQEDLTSKRFENGITEAQGEDLFNQDLVPVEQQVNSLNLILTQGQFDALVSFTYNLGIDKTHVMLSHGTAQVPQQMPRWVYAGGKVLPGLVKRRNLEVQWWNS